MYIKKRMQDKTALPLDKNSSFGYYYRKSNILVRFQMHKRTIKEQDTVGCNA